MKTVAEYEAHAEDCRRLAHSMSGEQRDQILKLAKQWDQLALDRAQKVYPDKPAQEPDPAS